MNRAVVAAIAWAAGTLCAQTTFYPLKDVRPGLRGAGRTVMSGDRVEEFQVEILGVLENAGPNQSIILGRLSGGGLEHTGVLQGMSGSPVYVDGRLLGAVALSFAYTKEPVAGIRPIEEMLRARPMPPAAPRARLLPPDRQLAIEAPPREEFPGGPARMVEIATPVALSGFTRRTLDHFAPELRSLGLEPRQGVLGGGRPGARIGDPSALRPGGMISVQLLAGDMSVGAEGTITHIDGRNLYAFGHRFLSVGATELPFARAEVLTIVPNLATSFKISAAREWMGAITADHSTGIAGELGRRAAMVPVSISVKDGERSWNYRLEMVRDRLLSPFLLQMGLFSIIDATGRTVGASTFAVRGRVEFDGGIAPLRLENVYAGENNVALLVAFGAALPLSYCMQSGLDGLRLKNIAIDLERHDDRRQWRIDQVWASPEQVRPGETVEITAILAGENGAEVTRQARYAVPPGARTGPIHFTVSDGAGANLAEFQQILSTTPRTAAQMIALLNRLRDNSRAYVRVWREEPNFLVDGRDLAGPPPSAALILARAQSSLSGALQTRNTKVAEIELDAGGGVVNGSRTIQVEVRE